ncbi:MAG: response regulator [Puniceicoccales bacterium]
MKVLYWDDQDAVLENVSRKLEKLRHQVVTAKTIDDCKAALANKEAPVDLFIADYSIDENNGMTFVMGVKAEDPELHVVVLSPSILRSEFNQLQMCGITVMKKPILIDQVVRPFLNPDKRRKKPSSGLTVPPMPTSEAPSGLLDLAAKKHTPPADMPPHPPPATKPAKDSETAEEPPQKRRKGFTSLFARSGA